MAAAGGQTIALLNKLIERTIERGEEITNCLTLLREFSDREEKNAERTERAAEREARSRERDRELRVREIDLQEKELELKKHLPDDGSHKSDQYTVKTKLPKYIEGEDIEVFLTSFERLALVHNWPKSKWPIHLIPQLSGKALEAYSRMSISESKNYDFIKKAILDRYGLNSWEYREKFRSCRQANGETFREYAVRLSSYFDHWKDAESIEEDYDKLSDLVLREQLLFSSDQYLQVWLREHQPKDVSELTSLAEAYQLAHKDSENKRFQRKNFQSRGSKSNSDDKVGESSKSYDFSQKQERRKCFVCYSTEHLIASCPYKVKTEKNLTDSGQKVTSNLLCSPTKHKVNAKVVEIPVAVDLRTDEFEIMNGLRISKGLVNGRLVSVLRDTGCSAIFVSEELVDDKIVVKKENKTVTLADGSMRDCKEVQIELDTPYISGTVDALVMSNPFADLVIGNVGYYYSTSNKTQTFQAITRKMAKEGEIERAVQEEAEKTWKADAYCSDTSDTNQSKKDDILSSNDLIEEQKNDETLRKVRELAKSSVGFSRNAQFLERQGKLYRAFKKGDGTITEQIVVPKRYRPKLLHIAHDVPLSGHMGNRKTRTRLLQNFFWPGIFKDVAEYCRSCPECQRSVAKGKIKRAPLIPIPPMAEPFTRVAIDIVGPLNRTKRGNRYILTLCDYATRFPEAIPLKTIDTESVAEDLMGIFSRLGIPREILTDQGSNFMSALMQKLCSLLSIKKLHCSPYHPEANGLVERFNGTLKRMLTCFVHDKNTEWDVLLPYLLFAYREVPQDTTGFSPFELLFDRHVRGPLTIVRESWEDEHGDHENGESVLSYIIRTRDKLCEIGKIAGTSEINSKKVQKRYYDQKAIKRELKEGQLVCVLLPTVTNKLLAQWKGPYKVLEKVSPVDYVVQVGKSKNKCKTFHINMLKDWNKRSDLAVMDNETVSKEEKEDGEMVSALEKEVPICLTFSSNELDEEEEIKVIHCSHHKRV